MSDIISSSVASIAAPDLIEFHLVHMYPGNATMRLAISVGREEGDVYVANFKRMALAELLAD